MGASRYLVGFVFSALFATGCAAGSDEGVDAEDFDLEVEAAAVPAPAAPPDSTCALIQRGGGLGQVADTDIALGNGASYAMGWYPQVKSGLSTTDHWAVFRFDFAGVVPAGKVVSYAAMNVHVGWNNQSATVNVHRVKFPWNEATAAWNNFGGTAAFDAASVASFNGIGNGYKTIELTGLAQDWHSGAVANNGVLLEEVPVYSHQYYASEGATIEKRPSLWVCWADAPAEICAEPGAACQVHADCCDDTPCTGGICGGQPACGQPDAACGPGLPNCCSGICNDGFCPGSGGSGGDGECSASAIGTMCSADSDCCSGNCWDGMCVASTCTVTEDSGAACSPGACCAGGGHCVSDGIQGVCYSPEVLPSCVAPGAQCDPFEDFCCWGKSCGADGTCQ